MKLWKPVLVAVVLFMASTVICADKSLAGRKIDMKCPHCRFDQFVVVKESRPKEYKCYNCGCEWIGIRRNIDQLQTMDREELASFLFDVEIRAVGISPASQEWWQEWLDKEASV